MIAQFVRPLNRGREGLMVIVQAELSLYSLGSADLLPSIYQFIKRLERPGIHIEMGRLSTVITGEMELVFAAVQEAYATVAGECRHLLLIKMVNQIEVVAQAANHQ
jgi:uncharacterized protein YqgV (UPF0045/DUF77 family)